MFFQTRHHFLEKKDLRTHSSNTQHQFLSSDALLKAAVRPEREALLVAPRFTWQITVHTPSPSTPTQTNQHVLSASGRQPPELPGKS